MSSLDQDWRELLRKRERERDRERPKNKNKRKQSERSGSCCREESPKEPKVHKVAVLKSHVHPECRLKRSMRGLNLGSSLDTEDVHSNSAPLDCLQIHRQTINKRLQSTSTGLGGGGG